MGDSRIKDISLLLANFFSEDRLRRGEKASSLFGVWPSIVGNRFSVHSHIDDVDKGILIVEADHPGWIQLLQLRQSNILETIKRRYPEFGLRGIAFRLSGEKSNSSTYTGQEITAVVPAPSDLPPANGESLASLDDIRDPDLRGLLEKLKKTLQGKD